MEKNSRKVYIIKGEYSYDGNNRQWIERITLSKERALEIKNKLNKDLLDEIERGGEIAYNNLKVNPDKTEWNERIYSVDNMSEEEHRLFCLYTQKNPVPFRIYELELS